MSTLTKALRTSAVAAALILSATACHSHHSHHSHHHIVRHVVRHHIVHHLLKH